MNFTSKEKCAIINVLLSIMKADGAVDATEQDFLDKVYNKFDITADEVFEAAHMEAEECRQILRAMSEEKSNRVSKCFLDMVSVDGHVDLRELRVIKDFF